MQEPGRVQRPGVHTMTRPVSMIGHKKGLSGETLKPSS